MKNSLLLLFLFLSFSFPKFLNAQGGGGCSPVTSYPFCGSAQSLTVGASCENGITCSGGSEDPAGSCLYSGSECSWYSFTASANDMFVQIDVTSTDGCHISSSVYSGGCGSLSEVSCESGAPLSDLHSLTGLTVGATYYVQVCYAPGGPCGKNGVAEYCINVGEPDPPCETCSNPCGTAQGYTSAPPVDTVVADCETSPFSPELQPSTTHTFCYSFTATDTDVDFNVIITSNCGGGNVTNLTWDLYSYPSCGGPVQSGDINDLTFNGLTVGNDYVFCYTFTVPSTCTHSQHCPYFVGGQPLPVDLIDLSAIPTTNRNVKFSWTTASEQDNDHFKVQRSKDGQEFENIQTVKGSGTSSSINDYYIIDDSPYSGISYYRLAQVDIDGTTTVSRMVAVDLKDRIDEINLFPNPVQEESFVSFNLLEEGVTSLIIYDVSGRKVVDKEINGRKGSNTLPLNLKELDQGLYFLRIQQKGTSKLVKFTR